MTKEASYSKLEQEIELLRKELLKYKNDAQQLAFDKEIAEATASTLLNLSDNIPAYIAIVDAKTLIYKFVNSQFTKGFNKQKENIIGAHISEIIGSKNTEFAMPYINKVREGKSASYTNTFDLAEGKRYANVNYVPEFNKDGEVENIIVLTHDITATKSTEFELVKAKELANQKESYSKILFHSSPIGLALTTLKGKLIDVNKAYANIIGYSIDETLKLSYWDITPEKYSKQEAIQLDSLNKTGSYGPYEKEYIHKSGKLVPVSLEGKIIEIDGGKFIWSSVQDISERRINEQLLKDQNKELERAIKLSEESEMRYRALHDASSGGIGIHDKGLILDCNQGLANITGYNVDSLIGMNGLLLIAEQSRDEVMQNILSGYEKPYIVIGLRKNGEEFPLQIEGREIPYKGQNVRVVEFRDISDLKKTEKKLIQQNEEYNELNIKLKIAKDKAEESEKQLKLIANSFVDGMIYQVATINENTRKFTYVSDAASKLYGHTPEEIKGNPDLIYGKIHKDDIENLIQQEKEAIKNMAVFKAETRVINPDGSIRWSFIISQPRIINNIMHWDGFEIDITERKKLEQELINAKEQAVESDRLKSAFLANMSHEIRTPMNSILGFSQLLKEPDISLKDREKYIDLISIGGNRLLTIISDIVDVSKIDAKQLTIIKRSCNVNELIENLKQQFAITEYSPKVNLSATKGLNNTKCIIETDETRLMQILSNLLENALKFTEEGTVEFGYLKNESSLQFFVKDSGIGIDPKNHDLVFDRFRQVNESYNYSGSGTGLGLSIVKGLVKLLGGEIWIESEINKGSTFFFTIPIL